MKRSLARKVEVGSCEDKRKITTAGGEKGVWRTKSFRVTHALTNNHILKFKAVVLVYGNSPRVMKVTQHISD